MTPHQCGDGYRRAEHDRADPTSPKPVCSRGAAGWPNDPSAGIAVPEIVNEGGDII
jgi:hypothetical protein